MTSMLRCINCGAKYPSGGRFRCDCGGLLEIFHRFTDFDLKTFDERLGLNKLPYISGVWRYKELIHPEIDQYNIVSRPEGNTNIYTHRILSEYVGSLNLSVKHEGENPTGSFKDRGMTVGISEAKRLGSKIVACASTGNTSASLAAYAAQAGIKCVVFIPEGLISYGKLAQAISYGAKVLQIKGNFDDAMKLVQIASEELGLYLLNSVNPWRIEGQKTIVFELLQQREWIPSDWIIIPAGNLGNTSAFGKALKELKDMELINKVPRIASIQAEGANPFHRLWMNEQKSIQPIEPETIASAIRIGNPVSWKKALKTIQYTNGTVESVSDQNIMDAKAMIDKSGIGCEPASAASIAGAKKLVNMGIIDEDEDIICILTGNILKDPETSVKYHTRKIQEITPKFPNMPISVDSDIKAIKNAILNKT